MGRGWLQTIFFVGIGLMIGALLANFKSNDYRHTSLFLKTEGEIKPLPLNDFPGRQVIALSLKNLQPATDIRLQGEGISIQSWYPPVLPLPFRQWVAVAGGQTGEEFRVSGVRFGQRLPLYLIVDGSKEGGGCRELVIRNGTNGALLRTVHLMPGGNDGGHH